MSRWAPIAAALLDRRQDRDAVDEAADRRAELGVEDRRDVLELAVLADDPALAVRLDRVAQGRLAPAHELVAEDLAGVDELGDVLGVPRPRTGS